MIDYVDKLTRIGQYRRRSLDQVKYLIIHHSASTFGDPDLFNKWHIMKGWPAIGYHYVLDGEKVWRTNPIDRITYHCKGYNTASIGICVIGDFEEQDVSPESWVTLNLLINSIRDILPALELRGHKDFGNTLCPGKNLYDKLFPL